MIKAELVSACRRINVRFFDATRGFCTTDKKKADKYKRQLPHGGEDSTK